MVHYNQLTLPQRTLTQVGTGLLIGIPLALVVNALPKREPRASRERRVLGGRSVRGKSLVGAVLLAIGIAAFVVIGASDIYFAHTGDRSSFAFQALLFCDSIFGQGVGFSIAGALSLGAATAGAGLAWSERGIPDGLRRGVTFVAAPVAIAFIAGIREYDEKEMATHATNFLAGITVAHTDLVSNWTMLVIAMTLAFAGIYFAGESKFRQKRGVFHAAMAAALIFTLLVVAVAISTQTLVGPYS